MFYSIILYLFLASGLAGSSSIDYAGDSSSNNDRPDFEHRDDSNGQSTSGGGK